MTAALMVGCVLPALGLLCCCCGAAVLVLGVRVFHELFE